ncbi:MAG: hypothetical protein AAGA03_03825, partial [Planctomycetota bacterium]
AATLRSGEPDCVVETFAGRLAPRLKMETEATGLQTSIRTQPPAKLNLFLELHGQRPDGYHSIDTVMVPIDWFDELEVWQTDSPGVTLEVDWLPSRPHVAKELAISDSDQSSVLSIPTDASNLVVRALQRFLDVFGPSGGLAAKLGKRIPAGAGMGGASSDAASALRSAALLHGIDPTDDRLLAIAAEIGSDVPFFFGVGGQTTRAARATGRGEHLNGADLPSELSFLVVYPNVSLPTGQVYRRYATDERANPTLKRDVAPFLAALASGISIQIAERLHNRLSDAARGMTSRIDEILEILWQSGARACQLTGSGSACFAIYDSTTDARAACDQVRGKLGAGHVIRVARSMAVPTALSLHGS